MSNTARHNSKPVLIVGGANGERVLFIKQEQYKQGRKYILPPSNPIGGGSSINHACRLLAVGVDILPIVPVIDDHTGCLVVNSLTEASQTGGLKFRFRRSWYLRPKTKSEATQFTTIINIGEERNVFSEFGPGLAESFLFHYNRTIRRIATTDISALVIGHIYADRELHCDITRRLIDKFGGSVPIIANFGKSQYEAGHLAWSNALKQITYFQLDIIEIRNFFGGSRIRLGDILEWFRKRCTVAITLDRMGAVAQVKDTDQVFFIWPYELPAEMLVDTTGAGDAFAAGITWGLRQHKTVLRSVDAWRELFEQGALWAAYACCQEGGTRNCPDLEKLNNFKKEHTGLVHGIDVFDALMGERILRLIDRAFP